MDKPVIRYVVEETVDAGVTDILMVIGKGKRAIEEHCDRNGELEQELAKQGRKQEAESIRRISEMANVHFVWQKELRGLGDAIGCAKAHIGNVPFLILLGDTFLYGVALCEGIWRQSFSRQKRRRNDAGSFSQPFEI